ncbi:MAG: NAD(P)-binding domain-containing protein [Actinomycetota bacterium]|nr:NAD(P)-binding domain-containing protein [Actinomycetota bacterium]
MSVPTASSLPTVGVLGSGPVGQGIAELLSRADYPVSLGTRQPHSTKLDRLPPEVERTTFQQAAQAEHVFLAVLHSASRELVLSLEDNLKGKLLVDTDNAWLPGQAQAAGLNASLTEGSWMAQLLPQTHVTRAFSHIDWDKLVPAATHQPDTWAVGYAADDALAATQLEALIRAMRYLPYRVGTLTGSAAIDVGGVLWPGMYTPTDMRALLTAAE